VFQGINPDPDRRADRQHLKILVTGINPTRMPVRGA
jgi:hypothetical protein